MISSYLSPIAMLLCETFVFSNRSNQQTQW